MSTGRHTFRLNDLKRVIRAAKAEGFAVDVELARDKAIVRTKGGQEAKTKTSLRRRRHGRAQTKARRT